MKVEGEYGGLKPKRELKLKTESFLLMECLLNRCEQGNYILGAVTRDVLANVIGLIPLLLFWPWCLT
jgi:hypothetical protein